MYSVAFSPNGRTLATGTNSRHSWRWDAADPSHPSLIGPPLTGGTGAAYATAFSPDSHALVSGNADGTIRMWDVSNAAQPQPLGLPAGADGAIRAWCSALTATPGQRRFRRHGPAVEPA